MGFAAITGAVALLRCAQDARGVPGAERFIVLWRDGLHLGNVGARGELFPEVVALALDDAGDLVEVTGPPRPGSRYDSRARSPRTGRS